MNINVKLSIGYPGAMVEDTLEVDDDILEGMTDQVKDDYFNQLTEEWAEQYVEYWYEEEDE